jgi:hypothetical protein
LSDTASDDGDLAGQLLRLLAEIGPALAPAPAADSLRSITATAVVVFEAAACSIAALDSEVGELVYLAATGEGADEVTGLRLPLGRGIAGFVASSGQGLSVEEVRRDARFAADVAERTGYVPEAILAVPISEGDDVLGVLSVLDRGATSGAAASQALELAGRFADQAAQALTVRQAFDDLGKVLGSALAQLADDADRPDLAEALRTAASDAPSPSADLVALIGELAALGPAERTAATRIVGELTSYATHRRRGRR